MDSMREGRRSPLPTTRVNSNSLVVQQEPDTQRSSTYQKIIIEPPGAPQGSLAATNLAAVIVGTLAVILWAGIAGGVMVVAIMVGIIQAGTRRR